MFIYLFSSTLTAHNDSSWIHVPIPTLFLLEIPQLGVYLPAGNFSLLLIHLLLVVLLFIMSWCPLCCVTGTISNGAF